MTDKTECKNCKHEGECDCMCCGSILKGGCITCAIPTLVYRGLLKLRGKKNKQVD